MKSTNFVSVQSQKTGSTFRFPIQLGFALMALAVGWTTSAGRAQAAARPPNVLFIIADDLNCDLGCYGHPVVQSPNIDRLARRGVRFEQAFCQYPLCGPSRASFMCGLYPDQTLIRRNAIRVRERLPEVETMSQMFRRGGYRAVRVGKIYHYNVPRDIGTDGHDDPESWEEVFNPRGRDKDDEPLIFSLRPGQFGGTLSWLAAEGTDLEQTDGIGASKAIQFLERFAQNRQRFFLAVGFYRPHTPYVAPKKYFELYPRAKMVVPRVPPGYLATLPEPARRSLTRKKDQLNLPDNLARQAIQAYHASTTFMDAQVGRVLNALERLNLADDTIVLFTSDHGYHMGEHAYYQKTTLFENATHVPLIIAVPGMKTAGRSTKALAEMIDFYPTLAELCGLRAPRNLPGRSLAPILKNPTARVHQAVLTQYATGYSLRTPRYRYTEWGPDGRDGAELYDRQKDPEELVNLASRPEPASIIKQLSRQIRERIRQARRVPAGLKQIAPPAKQRRKAK